MSPSDYWWGWIGMGVGFLTALYVVLVAAGLTVKAVSRFLGW